MKEKILEMIVKYQKELLELISNPRKCAEYERRKSLL